MPKLQSIVSSYAFRLLMLVSLNYVFGKAGLMAAAPPGYATLIWPPSGIAAGILAIFGMNLWPGVFAASLLLNAQISNAIFDSGAQIDLKKFVVPACIAAGSSLQAICAGWILRRYIGRVERGMVMGAASTAVLAGPLACLIAASVGSATLFLSGAISADKFIHTFMTWWVGDILGTLVFAPLVLFCFMTSAVGKTWGTHLRLMPSLIALMLLVAVGIVLAVWKVASQYSYDKALAQFGTLALESEKNLLHRFDAYEHGLRGALAFIQGSEFVSRGEWKVYVDFMDIQQNLPGIIGIGYIKQVDPGNVESFIEATRKDGSPDFKVHPGGYNDKFYVITYIEPAEKNSAAIGLNIAFEEKRRNAAVLAAKTGNMAITEVIKLVQDKQGGPGFLLLLPIYKKGDPLATAEERLHALDGWVYAPIVARDFINQLTRGRPRFFNLSIYNGQSEDPENLIFSDHFPGDKDNLFTIRRTVEVKQQAWTIVWESSEAFEELFTSQGPKMILLGGGVFTLLLAVLLVTLMRRAETVQRLVELKTSELRDREAILEQTVEKLTLSNAELERFAYVASHDMQEPLRMVTNFSSLLTRQHSSGLDAEAKRYMGYITTGAARLQALVSDLLEFARISKNGHKAERVDTAAILLYVLENLSARIEETQAEITHDDLPPVRGHAVQIICLLQNLLSNALKYYAKGVRPVIHVGCINEAGQLQFYIRDNGIGIAEKHRLQVFEPLKRLHSAGEYEGTGLGLSICRKIVTLHGGRIWVEAAPGGGSIFFFTLPPDAGDTAG